jgi:hypothetical protein
LSLAFPTLDGAKSIAVKLAVGLNGEISVNGTITDGAGDNAHDIDGKKALKWAKGLEICGTVGVWIEWIRGEESA